MNAREDAVWVSDTITQLQAENARLRAALKPFAGEGAMAMHEFMQHCINARRALEQNGDDNERA